ncbi:phosphomannomutase [Shewanella rhizosphaerae]|uniref:phosphomannomutase n=1 Tax=Shewanella rhizosphaerae TaxID=2864207 RepID=UPI001C6578BB|nr:phosphomannomutase [Shewanella rhizosphaerae]QYK14264.1 phosphomannomutase [Shewanella rhizosphaerae]
MTQVCVSQVIKESGVAFGTSGARGLVTDFKSEVCAAFTLAFIQAMQQSFSFKRLAIAIDNRPSSPDIAAACIAAAKAVGIEVDYYGVIPTPALAVTSLAEKIPAIMVTGSHIPFDRNGLKFYRPDGEISKEDELDILAVGVKLPKVEESDLPRVQTKAADYYLARYLNVFGADLLKGKRIGIYEHSSAGRDLYANLFEQLGATVVSLGRSDCFVPIDTEAVGLADIEMAKNWQNEYQLDAIFSTDGDGDRPLLSDETGTYLRGDILCLLAAKHLNIEAVAVPVSCNTAIEASGAFQRVERTKIGSPYVIAAFDELNHAYQRVAGFEANGGFLLGSDVSLNGAQLSALPTRDAVLPVLAVLVMASKSTISSLVDRLPSSYTASDRIQNFPRNKSLEIIEQGLKKNQQLLSQLGITGFKLATTDTTDGLRMTFTNGEIVHLRPSGNAPELRCYAESDSVERAELLVKLVLSAIDKLK